MIDKNSFILKIYRTVYLFLGKVLMSQKYREKILHTSLTLFMKHGFHATGIDKIVAEAGIAKMTLYKYFPSKEALIMAVLQMRDQAWRTWFQTEIENFPTHSPQEKILIIFDVLASWFKKDSFHGCAFINASAEFSEQTHPAHLFAALHKQYVQNYIHDLINALEIANAGALSRQICLLMDGAIVQAQITHNPDVAFEAKNAATLLLHTACLSQKE